MGQTAPPVNEIDHMLQYLEFNHRIKMRAIATKIDLTYNYVKWQKKEKDPEKQSEKLALLIKSAYPEELKDMPPYRAYNTGIDISLPDGTNESANNSDQYRKKDEPPKDFTPEEEYRHEMERIEQLNDIRQRLEKVEKNQDTGLAFNSNLARYTAKKDSNGDPQKEEEIYNLLMKGNQSEDNGNSNEIPPN